MLRRLPTSLRLRRLLHSTSGLCQLGEHPSSVTTHQCCSSPAHAAADVAAHAADAAADADAERQQRQWFSAAVLAGRMERKPLAPPGYSRTFYKRRLPTPPAIEFASDQGEY